MPRPKGSRNKKNLLIENVDEKLAGAEREIERLNAALKAARNERRTLLRAKCNAEKLAAERKAEEERRTLLAAVEASGKSMEEILSLLE